MKKTIMEKTFKKLAYSFIAVPTNLFYCLDTNLRNCLIVLLHLSSIFADADGYFSISNQELQEYFRLGKNLTSVCLETLYRNGLISTRIELTKSKKNLIKYRVNTEKFEEYNKFNFKSIVDNDGFYINTLDYGKDSNFKVTYTAATAIDSSSEEVIPEPTEVQNIVSEEIPSNEGENAPVGLETSNPAITEEMTQPEDDETEVPEDCPLTFDELKDNNIDIKRLKECKEPEHEFDFISDESEVEIAESPSEESVEDVKPIELDGNVIETASVFPTYIQKVEKRSFTNDRTEKLDDTVKQKCEDLVKRYVEMVIPSANQSLELSNKASLYIIDKYNNGYIDIETKDNLVRKLISARFEKFPI